MAKAITELEKKYRQDIGNRTVEFVAECLLADVPVQDNQAAIGTVAIDMLKSIMNAMEQIGNLDRTQFVDAITKDLLASDPFTEILN